MKKLVVIFILVIMLYVLIKISNINETVPTYFYPTIYTIKYIFLVFLGFALESDFKTRDNKKIMINIAIIIILAVLVFYPGIKYNIIFLPLEIQYFGVLLVSYIANYLYDYKIQK